MSRRAQAPFRDPIAAAAETGVAIHALAARLPDGEAGGPPEWITLFPSTGRVSTRDGRAYDVDAARLMAAFDADAVDLPVDINHATDAGALFGGRADAVGWVRELRLDGGALQGRVDWLDEGRALLAARKYRYVSPAFYSENSCATRLRAVALVTAPALARQPALASAQSAPETVMKQIAETLGLAADADEAACLAALTEKLGGLVPKAVHQETLTQLSAATTELTALKTERRKEKVDGVIGAALAAKKITPAEKDHYVALCATDAGLSSVVALLAAKTPLLPDAGLGDKPAPAGAMAPEQLAAKTRAEQARALAAGETISTTEALERVKRDGGRAAA